MFTTKTTWMVLPLLIATACSSEESAAGRADGGTSGIEEAGTGDGNPDASGSGGVDGGADTGGKGTLSACYAIDSVETCAACIGELYPAEYAAFLAATRDCVCDGKNAPGDAAPCAAECAADYCLDPAGPRSSSCEACKLQSISQGGACYGAVAVNCDAQCEAFQQKYASCPR